MAIVLDRIFDSKIHERIEKGPLGNNGHYVAAAAYGCSGLNVIVGLVVAVVFGTIALIAKIVEYFQKEAESDVENQDKDPSLSASTGFIAYGGCLEAIPIFGPALAVKKFTSLNNRDLKQTS